MLAQLSKIYLDEYFDEEYVNYRDPSTAKNPILRTNVYLIGFQPASPSHRETSRDHPEHLRKIIETHKEIKKAVSQKSNMVPYTRKSAYVHRAVSKPPSPPPFMTPIIEEKPPVQGKILYTI